MKLTKIAVAALLLIIGVVALTACGRAVENVSVEVIVNGETIIYIEVANYSDNLVAYILTANNDVLLIPQDQLNAGFITQIGGVVADWNNGEQWWRLEINGVPATRGINDARVSNGATITFIKVQGL